MKIVFLSNYFNHHQKPFSDEMYDLIGDDYYFIESEVMENDRIALGWQMHNKPSYVLQTYVDSMKCQKIVNEADVLITGSAPENLLTYRKKNGLLIIRYSERPLKVIPSLFKLLKKFVSLHKNNPWGKPIYMLCASAYTASDYKKFGIFNRKTYKWGYFPVKREYQNLDELIAQKERNSILWVARFIDWKHPELMIRLAENLLNSKIDFHITMIGCGVLEEKIKKDVANRKLNQFFTFLGAMSPNEVRYYMEKSEIFLSTSDRNEGWGAVINESMNSCCAVVANKEIGAAPFLINDCINGFTYHSFDKMVCDVKKLLNDKELRISISKSAYATISNLWNAKKAASNCLELCKSLLKNGKCDSFLDGPCSRC